jgi:hypothetical protein
VSGNVTRSAKLISMPRKQPAVANAATPLVANGK